MKTLRIALAMPILALTSLSVFAQPPAAPPAKPPVAITRKADANHGKPGKPAAAKPVAKAGANPDGITWNEKAKRFQNAKGKFVSKEAAHAAGVKGPATTPKSAPATKKEAAKPAAAGKMGKMDGTKKK
jgi:hypothetical protein